MFGDEELKELQTRKGEVGVKCAADRLELRDELRRAGSGLARFRTPFGWLAGAGSFFRSSPGKGWNVMAITQTGLKAFAVLQAVRAFFRKKRKG